MRLVGSIPKTKFMPDLGVMRTIEHILLTENRTAHRTENRVVGIFAEGRRSWDGRSTAVMPVIGKMLKRIGVPVIAARIVGGYLAKPRWAATMRRGIVSVEFARLLSASELERLSASAITRRVQEAIEHDDIRRCDELQRTFRCRRPAEWLEQVLFMCPHCGELDSLRSRRTILSCEECGFAVRYDDSGHLEPVVLFRTPGLHFNSVAKWNQWQYSQLRDALAPAKPDIGPPPAPRTDRPIFHEARARLRIGWRSSRPRLLGWVKMLIYADRLLLRGSEEYVIPIEQIAGANIQNRERLEFYWQRRLYRLEFAHRRACVYKWLLALLILGDISPGGR